MVFYLFLPHLTHRRLGVARDNYYLCGVVAPTIFRYTNAIKCTIGICVSVYLG